jgi:Tfp pilus assembly protein PilE
MGQRGVTVVDVVIVLTVIAALALVASLDFPRYRQDTAPAPAAANE